MATTATTLVQRCRRFLQDWGETSDFLTASCSSSITTLTVADATLFTENWIIQIEDECMRVRSGVGTTLTVQRAFRGTTGVTHATGLEIVVRPHFINLEYLDALNSGINACYPWLYQPVIDDTITSVTGTYEYTIPNLNSVPIQMLTEVWMKDTGDPTFRPVRAWDVNRGTTPKLRLPFDPNAGTIRLIGFSALPPLSGLSDSLSALFPVGAEDALTYYASQHLLASGEARRVREDTGLRDDREAALRPGSAKSIADAVYSRFVNRLVSSAMPPMPRQAVSIFTS